ncbi:hypothetical protein JEP92_01815 [Serratia surfactantfaciens]|uniref:ABC-three component system protein n=1 Tax=Serratia surfactantfaciens TaxID=2741499 RepID=UPI0018E4270E|nr:ABC-three component system protein [Serratia surfactantfaciens]MBI6150814.1 hypothetical protein [Serratia surfactantfaciens]
MPNTSALGQYLGYTLQTWRMLSYLLGSRPGMIVSLEEFDDISVFCPQKGIILEQDKSSISGNNPISNSSIDLWKTIYNWIVLIEEKKVEVARTKFKLYTRNRHESELIELFDKATNDDESFTAINKAMSIIENISNKTLDKYLDKISKTEKNNLVSIIKNFTYLHGGGDLNEEIRVEISSLIGVPPEYAVPLREHLLGWINGIITNKIEKERKVSISFEIFKKEIDAIVRKLDRKTIISSLVGECKVNELGDYKNSTFIKQLNIINCDENEIIQAAIYKRRAEDNVIKWSEAGLVHQSSYIEFNSSLKMAWQNHSGIEKIVNPTVSKVNLGRLILLKCFNEKIKLQGMDTEHYFIPGSYHQLSNSLEIGWHPEYKKLMEEKNEE